MRSWRAIATSNAVSLYLDTSCLLKLFFPEPQSTRTAALVARERRVVVSSLARLEALVQIQARVAGGLLSGRAAASLQRLIEGTLVRAPYDVVPVPGGIDRVAEQQILPMTRSVHCRTLDRLHLAAMQAFGLHRILTNDDVQARAAAALGFEVLSPR
jgi:predicted nucleic acid-binding protein